MNKKLWAVMLAAAVIIKSVVPVSFMDNEMVTAATKKPSTGTATAQPEDISTDGRTTAGGYTYRVSGKEAVITGYNGTAVDLTIPTKIIYQKTVATSPSSPTRASGTKPSTSKPATKPSTTKPSTTKPSSTKPSSTKPSATTPTTASTASSPSPSAIRSMASVKAARATKPNTASAPTVTVEYQVTSIDNEAFNGQLSIKSVTMAGGIDSNGKSFGIQKIGDKAFFACHDLEKLTIAASTTSIGSHAFTDCVALNSISVADGNPKYKVIEGSLYSYSTGSGTGHYTLEQYLLASTEKTYKMPDLITETLTGIGEGAFWGSVNLETVTLPPTVKTIGEGAFEECRKLTTVEFPEGLTSIGAEAFKGAVALSEITLPPNVTAINSRTFQGCESLKTVNMPDKLSAINSYAFQGCKSMEEFVVPQGVTVIGDQAFAQCESLREITIPTRTTSIGNGAFRGTTVTLMCHSGSQAAIYAANNGLSVERTYTVSFYSNALYSTLISSQDVVEGRDAVPPEVAEREGYRMRWSGEYTSVKQDIRVYTVWDKLYDVKFVDVFNGKTETVQVVKDEFPAPPSWEMDGYTLSWDQDLSVGVDRNFTVHAVWQNNTTGEILDPDAVRPQKKGTSLKKGNNQYKVTSANIKNPTVKFTGLSKAEVKKADIPAAITVKGVKYKVTEIASGVAKDNKNITKLIVNKNVTKIGSNAFYGCTKLKNIRLKSKSITKIGGKAFKSVSPKAVCYTYYSRQSRYKSMLKKAGIKKPNMKRL